MRNIDILDFQVVIDYEHQYSPNRVNTFENRMIPSLLQNHSNFLYETTTEGIDCARIRMFLSSAIGESSLSASSWEE